MARLLVIDDDPALLKSLTMIFRSDQHDVTALGDGREAERRLKTEAYDLVVSDVHMAPMDGLQLLGAVRAARPGTPVILMTAYASLELALQAVKNGAFDFVTKPFRVDHLLRVVRQALEYPRVVDGHILLEAPRPDGRSFAQIVARSAGMQAVCRRLEQLALTDEMVAILGEPGTGKRLVARILHAISRRKERPFVAVDCAAESAADLEARLLGRGAPAETPGVFESAAGGGVLLGHVENLPVNAQVQVMRLVKERRFVRPGDVIPRAADIRILASCDALPQVLPRDDAARVEWVQMLAALAVTVPPLRERRADLLPLISRLLHLRADPTQAEPWRVAAQAYDVLDSYAWPGNVRELEAVMRSAQASAQHRLIALPDLPAPVVQAVDRAGDLSRKQAERDALRGHSFREYVRMKQQELAHAFRKAGRVA